MIEAQELLAAAADAEAGSDKFRELYLAICERLYEHFALDYSDSDMETMDIEGLAKDLIDQYRMDNPNAS